MIKPSKAVSARSWRGRNLTGGSLRSEWGRYLCACRLQHVEHSTGNDSSKSFCQPNWDLLIILWAWELVRGCSAEEKISPPFSVHKQTSLILVLSPGSHLPRWSPEIEFSLGHKILLERGWQARLEVWWSRKSQLWCEVLASHLHWSWACIHRDSFASTMPQLERYIFKLVCIYEIQATEHFFIVTARSPGRLHKGASVSTRVTCNEAKAPRAFNPFK